MKNIVKCILFFLCIFALSNRLYSAPKSCVWMLQSLKGSRFFDNLDPADQTSLSLIFKSTYEYPEKPLSVSEEELLSSFDLKSEIDYVRSEGFKKKKKDKLIKHTRRSVESLGMLSGAGLLYWALAHRITPIIFPQADLEDRFNVQLKNASSIDLRYFQALLSCLGSKSKVFPENIKTMLSSHDVKVDLNFALMQGRLNVEEVRNFDLKEKSKIYDAAIMLWKSSGIVLCTDWNTPEFSPWSLNEIQELSNSLNQLPPHIRNNLPIKFIVKQLWNNDKTNEKIGEDRNINEANSEFQNQLANMLDTFDNQLVSSEEENKKYEKLRDFIKVGKETVTTISLDPVDVAQTLRDKLIDITDIDVNDHQKIKLGKRKIASLYTREGFEPAFNADTFTSLLALASFKTSRGAVALVKSRVFDQFKISQDKCEFIKPEENYISFSMNRGGLGFTKNEKATFQLPESAKRGPLQLAIYIFNKSLKERTLETKTSYKGYYFNQYSIDIWISTESSLFDGVDRALK